MVQQMLFAVVMLAAIWWAWRQFSRIRRNILLGKDVEIGGQAGARWSNVLLVALGQQKMFKNWLPAIFHLFIYVAFIFTQIELVEILIDGVTGSHRFFASSLGGFYTLVIGTIEVLSILALVATIIFLARRNVLRVSRFWKPEMKGWPFRDANLILLGEILLIIGIFSMNGADTLLQRINPDHFPDTGAMAISSLAGPAIFGGLSESALVGVERFGWWLHLLVVLGFLNYLPSSKHLHILLSFPNAYYANLLPKGKVENMPEIMNEVKSMMGIGEATASTAMGAEIPTFGANDVFSLSWKNLLDANTCTECGRCTAACPANLTGKKLSPRKIMMDVRDRMEEVGRKIDAGNPEFIAEGKRVPGAKLGRDNFDDGRSLFDYISKEEIRACTTCNACVEACPVLINPLEIIMSLRRYEILTESAGPSEWLPLFNSIENGGSAWQIALDRDHWTRELSSS